MRKAVALFFILSLFCSCNKSEDDKDITLTVASKLKENEWNESCDETFVRFLHYVKFDGGDNWETFRLIKGFDYEEGYEYVVTVRKVKMKEYIADAPDTEYHLVKIISKEEKDSTGLPE